MLNGSSLPITGERTMPGVPEENYWFRRHEVVYAFATALVAGTTLDAGCGEGYGASTLSQRAERVIGLDYDTATIAHAARSYPELFFVRANLVALPIGPETIETVTCLQVIEHLWDASRFLAECRRVLRPGGRLLLSTPNRLTFSPHEHGPTNLFHSHEFTAAELVAVVRAAGFGVESVLGLHAGPRLRAFDARYGGSFTAAQLAAPAAAWPDALRDDVAAVSAADFDILNRAVDAALDLIVVARR